MATSLYFFTISLTTPNGAQEELNQFLAAHRVVALEKQWYSTSTDMGWAVCVTVLAGLGPLPVGVKLPSGKAGAAERM